MYLRNLTMFAATVLAAGMLWGCGSSIGNSPVDVTGPTTVATNDPTPTVPLNAAVSRTDWALVPTMTITDATVVNDAVNPADGQLTVNFTVVDQSGAPVAGLTGFSFIAAQLVPSGILNGAATQSAQHPYIWQSYINRVENASATGVSGGQPNNVGPVAGLPVFEKAIQATTENSGTLVDNGGGSYSYTFAMNLKTGSFFPESPATIGYPFLGAGNLAFNSTRTHRVAIQLSAATPDTRAPANAFFDFVPAGGAIDPAVNGRRLVAETASCNACHDGRLAIHGGNRVDVGYCVTCHNPGTVDANSGFNLDMANMVHKIHRGANLPSVKNPATADEYAIWGFRASKHDYTEVHYPSLYYGKTAEPLNCTACHTSSLSTPDGNNWYTKTSDLACFSCHDDQETVANGFAADKKFVYNSDATYSRHAVAGTDPYPADQANIGSRNCGGCHTGTTFNSRRTFHAHSHDFSRPQFQYLLESVTVNAARQPVIKFRIKMRENGLATNADGSGIFTDMDLLAARPTVAPKLGGGTPGTAFGTPVALTGAPSFALIYSTTGTDWDLARANGQPESASIGSLSGAFGATPASPVGTLERNDDGSFTATLNAAFPEGASRRAVFMQGYFSMGSTRLDTPSPLIHVQGDTPRREIVEQDKCLGCHGGIGFHGGNRVDNPMVCAGCHNPRLTSSGHTLAAGLPEDEVSNNFKDMIHGVHGGTLVGVRNFNNNATAYDFTGINYPGVLSNCLACHKEGTYAQPASGAAVTTNTTIDRSSATAGADDLVTSPYAASCVGCHNNTESLAHFRAFDGAVRVKRSEYQAGERCALCHSATNPVAPVDGVHSGLQ